MTASMYRYGERHKISGKGPVVLVSRDIAYTFPMSYAYLAGYLKERGEDVRIVFKDGPPEEVAKRIAAQRPILVGFGSLYPELAEVSAIIRALDQSGRDFPVVIGGQMVSPIPEFAVRITGADFGVIGEGEITLYRLVVALREGKDPSGIGGLAIRQGDDIFLTGPGDYIEDLSVLPAIPYECFPAENWLHIGLWYAQNFPQPQWRMGDRVINVHGGRGCPFNCNFCYHHSKARYRPVSLMIEEAAEALTRFNGNMLYFSDDLVLHSPKRAKQLIEELGRLGRRVEYSVSARFDILSRMDDALLKELRDTGCRNMGLGMESGSDRMLELIGKNCTAEMIMDGLRRLQNVGIYPAVGVMIGQYTETRDDVEASISLMRSAVRNDPHINFAFNITTPFPGSPLYDLIMAKGYLRSHGEFYDRYFATNGEMKQVVNLSAMTDNEVMDMYNKMNQAYLEEKNRHPKKIIQLNADKTAFRVHYSIPFSVDYIIIDVNQSVLIRCISDQVDEVDFGKGFQGSLIGDMIAMAANRFPEIREYYSEQTTISVTPFSRWDLPNITENGKAVSQWFAIYQA
jgi:anaerobic magnesium-protoporphyrin IX monomethyl ester cyclase